MAHSLVITFDQPADWFARGAEIHRIRNFGEALFSEFRTSGLGKIEVADIDRATDRLSITDIKTRKYHRVEQVVRRILAEHHLEDVARVSEGA